MPLPLTPHLTPRELQDLVLIVAGCTNAQIAAELCLACHTAEEYVSRLLSKFHVRNRTQLAMKAVELQLTDRQRLSA